MRRPGAVDGAIRLQSMNKSSSFVQPAPSGMWNCQAWRWWRFIFYSLFLCTLDLVDDCEIFVFRHQMPLSFLVLPKKIWFQLVIWSHVLRHDFQLVNVSDWLIVCWQLVNLIHWILVCCIPCICQLLSFIQTVYFPAWLTVRQTRKQQPPTFSHFPKCMDISGNVI